MNGGLAADGQIVLLCCRTCRQGTPLRLGIVGGRWIWFERPHGQCRHGHVAVAFGVRRFAWDFLGMMFGSAM